MKGIINKIESIKKRRRIKERRKKKDEIKKSEKSQKQAWHRNHYKYCIIAPYRLSS